MSFLWNVFLTDVTLRVSRCSTVTGRRNKAASSPRAHGWKVGARLRAGSLTAGWPCLPCVFSQERAHSAPSFPTVGKQRPEQHKTYSPKSQSNFFFFSLA